MGCTGYVHNSCPITWSNQRALARATGRTRNELMVEALRSRAERQVREIAMIQEGLAQSRAGLGSPIEDVVAQLKTEGLLPADFVLGADVGQAGA